MAILNGCSDLNSGKVAKFCEKIIDTSNHVTPEKLPPTSNAARFHSKRLYHQVQA